MTTKNKHRILTYFIATVWLVNGLFCKMLNLVPRHEQIVGAILGNDYARSFTFLIGLSELIMAIWVSLRYKTAFNAMTQMVVVGSMNILEFILVPNLLLWGRLNLLFAMFFIALVFYNEFVLNKNLKQSKIK